MHIHFLIIAIFGICQGYGEFTTNNALTNTDGPNTAITNNVDGNQEFLNNIISNNNQCGVCQSGGRPNPVIDPRPPIFPDPPGPTYPDPPRPTFPLPPRPTFPDPPRPTFPLPPGPTFPVPPRPTFPDPSGPTFPDPSGPTFPHPPKPPCNGPGGCKLCNIDFPELSENPSKPWLPGGENLSNNPGDNEHPRPRPRPGVCPFVDKDQRPHGQQPGQQPHKKKTNGIIGLILSLL